ncbi:MAG: hypothetical protein IPM79_13975 [Polyangiaceae bacterium]|jgi:hypothetical protein|nr:hypothetical protein [Polyangiaceae bacterium]MBK8938704.1 hypothetical protein [Polyangiaceae bacterium]
MDLHATMRAWQREEDGSYKAEIAGLSLHVTWHPEGTDARRGFTWKIEGAGGVVAEAEAVEEEIEVAMALAEHAAKRHAK